MLVASILISAMILLVMVNIGNIDTYVNALDEAKAKTLEIRNALLYLNTVEEGTRMITLMPYFEAILTQDNITVVCNRPIEFGGEISFTRNLEPLPKNIIIPNSVAETKICLSKKITNCQNNITICKIEEDCCELEDLEDTLCTSSNQYLNDI